MIYYLIISAIIFVIYSVDFIIIRYEDRKNNVEDYDRLWKNILDSFMFAVLFPMFIIYFVGLIIAPKNEKNKKRNKERES